MNPVQTKQLPSLREFDEGGFFCRRSGEKEDPFFKQAACASLIKKLAIFLRNFHNESGTLCNICDRLSCSRIKCIVEVHFSH